MRVVAVTIAVALATFAGTMLDDFFVMSAQLALTDPTKHRRVARGQLSGVVVVITLAAGAGAALGEVPLHWVGVLAIAPLLLAVRAWRHRNDAEHHGRRGAVTTALVTIALSGDNVAVWTPLLRSDGVARGSLSVAVFVVADVAMVALAGVIARHPLFVRSGRRFAQHVMPALYLGLGVLVLWECQVL
jgi:cadmium resistance protein CadD (predicted permease)